MVKISDIDIENLIEKWAKCKKEMIELQKKLDKYKNTLEKIMNYHDTNKLSSEFYDVNRRTLSRTTITKRDVPNHLWEEFSKTIKYTALYLKNKN